MRRRLGTLIGLLAALALGTAMLGSSGPAYANAKNPKDGGDVGWKYSESGRGYYQEPQDDTTGGGGTTDPKAWIYVTKIFKNSWECPRPKCTLPGGANLVAIYCSVDMTPTLRRPQFIFIQWKYRYEDRSRHPTKKWRILDGDCHGTPEWVPIEEVSWHFEHRVRRRLPDPTIKLNPYPRGLVNLPVIVSTPDPGPQDYDFTIPPSQGRSIELHGTIHAEPHYVWTFEGGKTVHGAGRPYDGTDPRTSPGHYVTDTFGTSGKKNVHLQVRWTGTVTVEGLDPEPIEPVVFERDATVQVFESRAALND